MRARRRWIGRARLSRRPRGARAPCAPGAPLFLMSEAPGVWDPWAVPGVWSMDPCAAPGGLGPWAVPGVWSRRVEGGREEEEEEVGGGWGPWAAQGHLAHKKPAAPSAEGG